MLRHIAGLERPDGGGLEFGGPAQPPRVSLVFQEPRLLPWKTVNENLELALLDRPAAERKPAIAAALALVQLADCGASLPATLSGGMEQRVALARALFLKHLRLAQTFLPLASLALASTLPLWLPRRLW